MLSPTAERAIEDARATGNALLKFVSANDVDLTGGHQCGFYLPRERDIWKLFTDVPPTKGANADVPVKVVWQDGRETDSRIKWYGDKSRSEYRLTRFGRDFPFRTFDNVGDLLVLIPKSRACFHAYVLDADEDIEGIQSALGVEVFGAWGAFIGGHEEPAETPDECIDRHFRSIAGSLDDFPATAVFAAEAWRAVEDCIKTFASWKPDDKLLRLMLEEYRLFRMVERQVCASEIARPFKDVDDFLGTASTIANRRKSRAGRSLENHVAYLLRQSGIKFDARPRIDGKVEPDILIPGQAEYNDPRFPADRLCIVGIKTTCKDRWRQVLNEGRRVHHKHILTMQPGISANQLKEMHEANVSLIVPKPLHKEYPKDTGCQILTVDEFVNAVQVGQSRVGA